MMRKTVFFCFFCTLKKMQIRVNILKEIYFFKPSQCYNLFYRTHSSLFNHDLGITQWRLITVTIRDLQMRRLERTTRSRSSSLLPDPQWDKSWISCTKVRLSRRSKSLPPLRLRCVSSGTSFGGRPSGERKQTAIHFPGDGSPRGRQRPPGGCPAAPAPRTRMFGLENDFPTPSAPFSNCPKGNYLVSFPLKKNQEL